MQSVMCAFNCFDLSSMPPDFSLSCVANCVSQGCADAQKFADLAVKCAVFHLQDCFGSGTGGIFNCVQQYCGPQFAACIGATCN
jgi:hypothetical protein